MTPRSHPSLLAAGLAAGSLSALLFENVPAPACLVSAALGGIFLLPFAPLRWAGALILATCWSLWNFQQRLDDRLSPELAGAALTVRGIIVSIPREHDDHASFLFRPQPGGSQHDSNSAGADHTAPLSETLLVRWYEHWPPLAAGQGWELNLRLKPPWGSVNFRGADRERWLFANGIGGLGTVRHGQPMPDVSTADRPLNAIREKIFRMIPGSVSDPRSAAVLQALAVAESSGLTDGDREVLAATGTSHLLAISGLHVGLAAGAGVLAVRAIGWILPLASMGKGFYLLGLAGGALAAGSYTALANFGVPTVRALLMWLTVLIAVALTRRIPAGRAFLLALTGVLLVNPFAPLGAGFWFSFAAVAALLWFFAPRTLRGHGARGLLAAQVVVMVSLLPLSAAWYQSSSWVGLAANLVAIPVVGLLLVPLVLAGMALSAFSGALAEIPWTSAGAVAATMLWFLDLLAALPGTPVPLNEPGILGAVLGLAGSALLLLPRGLPVRWIGLFLLLPLFLRPASRTAGGVLELEVLDVGQGTAVLVHTAGRSLLYDTGPGNGAGRDFFDGAIHPAVMGTGLGPPDRVIVSHGDHDHAGGLASVRERFPRAVINANLREAPPAANACTTTLAWRWQDTVFRVLHPSPALPYLGNDSSCVLQIMHGQSRLLLAGDVSAAVETRLLGKGLAPAEVLLVPHHGSETSSSQAFIAGLRPLTAVATAALGNRFEFPKPAVQRRYEQSGSRFWSTGGCGALRFTVHAQGRLEATSARRSKPALWRWPAAPGCPVNDVFSVSFGHPRNTLQSTE